MTGVTVTMRGVGGELRWGYRVAGTLPTWELIGNANGGTVTGPVIGLDNFAATQQPLSFVVPRPAGAWRWPIHSLQTHGPTVTVTVGPCEG